MLERFEGFDFLLDMDKAKKQYFFNAHITKGCFRPSELIYFYHKPLADYLKYKIEQGKLPQNVLFVCFDHKEKQENFFVWNISIVVDDQEYHELYKLNNIRIYYRILMPEEEYLDDEPIPVLVLDH